ncbi:head morphogenesis [Gordonia phage Vivi2]|uniref:MuF-like minor capsid protein n=1 Tax=Gordonia phage Vivi2 TaxID=1821564 RepID=A0A142K9R3_9CAUD|nr:head morphogenesis [Gordonia phage Vivi2]AMS02846.1 MuF-like minor capsid protein [Gordonia phage Vivi2]
MARAVARRRAEHQQLLRRAERGIDAAVLAAMDVWLTAVRFALVDELVPRRIVADAEYAVDAAVQRTWGVWQNQLENQVLPTVSVAFGDAFQQVRRADPQGAFAHQQQYLAEVSDRLRIWPAGAFEDIRPELLESLSDAVTIDEMTERVGRVLNIDAKSRKLRAQINDVEAQLADPDLDPADRPALTQWRRDLWEQHDESLNEWQWKARRIARTESHGAVSAGQLAAARVVEQQTGLRMWKRWLSTEDQRTRASHRVADGQTCPLDEPFRVGGFLLEHPADSISVAPHEVINCFVADTRVHAPGVQGSMRSRYTGRMVTVRMASGGVLTGTPNHPVLTERGWVGLGELHKGDQMIYARVRDGVGARVDPEVERIPATIGELHDAFTQSVATHRMLCGPVDFHGDISDGEVEVVRADRELRDRIDAAHREHVGDDVLEGRHSMRRVLPGDRATGEFVIGSAYAPHRIVGSVGEPGAFVGAGLAHAGVHGGGSVAGRDPVFEQHPADDVAADVALGSESLLRRAAEVTVDQARSVEHVAALLGYARVANDAVNVARGDAEVFGDVLRGLTGGVSLDRVIAVDVAESWSGHVFTLQSESAMFLAEGYIARNCRCTMLIYGDDELQDEFDDQGGKGPVEPGAVRIGPDDPDAADAAILQVAEREDRATPQVGQRGEDYGQQLPAQPLDVELTDERTPIPVPDLETASDQRLADYLIRTDERDGDPTLRDEVDAELSRRREAEAFEVQFGQPEYADDVIEVDDDDAWLDDPRFRDPGDDDTYESTDVEPDPDYDPDLTFDEWAAEPDEARLPDDAVPADPPLIPEPLDFDEGDEDWVALNDEWEWVRGALHETIAEGSTDYDLQELIEYVATLESARADLIAKAATVPDVDPIAAERAEYVELWGEAAAVAEFDPLHAPREETSEDRRRRALMEQADQLAEDRGISYEQALAEIQGLDPDQVRRREFVAEGKRQGLVSTSYASMLDELHNNLSFDWLLMCEDATNGQTLKPRSRDLGQFAADMLWKVNDNTARKHMSDEAALWFDQNGRITKADLGAMIEDGRWAFDAQAVLDLYATWPGRRLGGDYLA